MPVRNSVAVWEGDFKSGKGKMTLGSGLFKSEYNSASRFEHQPGTNPEELIAAAHAGCFSMFLSLLLQQQGYRAEHIHTVARVDIDKTGEGYRIRSIELETEAKVPEIEDTVFLQLAEDAKVKCPVSQALSSVPIKLHARLAQPMAA